MDFCFSKTSPIVETAKGKLRGFHFNGVDHFYGIRYAKARRFQMPEPVDPWEGVKDAGSYGMICPVLNEPPPSEEVLTPHRFWPGSEHCQYLNIWTNRCDPADKKPVMVWIHGGGFTTGSSIEQVCYDGFNLAKLDNVVLVSVNHRLNVFGYLDMSAFGDKYKNSVNVGMADLVEALRWVKENIAQFGGDPDNVTIFGQSGGGVKVTTLGQIPEADGLFHKAIILSGVVDPGDRTEARNTGKEMALAVMKNLRIPEEYAERLEKVPVPQFIWAVNKAVRSFEEQGRRVIWAPKPNDYFVGDPLEVDFTAHSLTVPTMVGTAIAEFARHDDPREAETLTTAEREELVCGYYGQEGGSKVLEEFRRAYPNTNEVYAMDLDDVCLPATVDYVKKKAEKATAPVYNYMFAKIFDYDGGRAAWHGADIPYFFHNADKIPVCHQTNYKMLNWVMSGAFVNFARTGNPNTEGLPDWEKCENGRMVTMVFDDKCYAQVNMQDGLVPLIRKYKPVIQPAPRALTEDEDEEGESVWVD